MKEIMINQSSLEKVLLAERTLITLPPETEEVTCHSGTLWVTQDNDKRDLILEAGDCFSPQHGRRVILYALRASVFTIHGRLEMILDKNRPRRAPWHWTSVGG